MPRKQGGKPHGEDDEYEIGGTEGRLTAHVGGAREPRHARGEEVSRDAQQYPKKQCNVEAALPEDVSEPGA